MKPLQLDLEKIRNWSKRREDENISFRSYLKGQDSDKIDRIVHRLNGEISRLIDCNTCGNCCKEFSPRVSRDEIKKLAEIDNIDFDNYMATQIENGEMGGDFYLKHLPCRYLDGTKCSILEDRPEECKTYPYLYKNNFVSRLWGVIDNYAVCPIVYNVVERLKDELGYSRKRRY